jgi:hypothetical protein
LENGHPLADHGEKFAFATFYARGFKTHLEHAIKVPNSIGLKGLLNGFEGLQQFDFAPPTTRARQADGEYVIVVSNHQSDEVLEEYTAIIHPCL